MRDSLYIHIPFCKKKCPYCDFYSIPPQKKLVSEYISIISQEISKLNTCFDTVYIGGGTPTVIDIHLWGILLESLKKILKSSYENTVEANPESLSKEKLKLFLKYNINRISIGLQSLNDLKLKYLGRIHDRRRGIKAVWDAKESGFFNINIDLIYGYFNESLKEWKKELNEAIKLPITHISCYALGYESYTPFYKFKSKVDEKEVAEMYLFNMNFLPKNGYMQYETSNFSLEGFKCTHNLRYWQGASYIGIGASAVSYIKGIRKKNISDVKEYIKRIALGESHVESKERLTREKQAKELAALKIRTTEGICFDWFKETTGFDFFNIEDRTVIESLKAKGLVRISVGKNGFERIFLTKKGYLFCDEVSSSLV